MSFQPYRLFMSWNFMTIGSSRLIRIVQLLTHHDIREPFALFHFHFLDPIG